MLILGWPKSTSSGPQDVDREGSTTPLLGDTVAKRPAGTLRCAGELAILPAASTCLTLRTTRSTRHAHKAESGSESERPDGAAQGRSVNIPFTISRCSSQLDQGPAPSPLNPSKLLSSPPAIKNHSKAERENAGNGSRRSDLFSPFSLVRFPFLFFIFRLP